MENEVVIHVRAEDHTAAGFAEAKRSAKKAGEEIERDLKQSGARGGKGLADGISDGISQARPRIVAVASSIGDAVSDKMETAGDRGGEALGDGIRDGLAGAAPAVLAEAGVVGQGVEAEMDRAGKAAGKKLADGIKEGLDGVGGGGIGEKLVPSLGGAGKKGGKKAGESFIDSFKSVLDDLGKNPYVMGGVAAAGVALAPLIGATLGAGVIGAAGAGGIVGGFAAAALDPRVQGASKALGSTLTDDLKIASKAFVPFAVDAIDEVRSAWKGILPDLERIFTQSAGLMGPLLDGILDGVTDLVDGIEESLGGAGPVFDAFGDLFGEVGAALGDLFGRMSDDGPAAAAAIDFLAEAIVAAIDATSIFIELSLALVEAFRPVGGVIADAVNVIDGWLDKLTGGEEQSEEFEQAQNAVAEATSRATAETEAQISALTQLEQTMRKQTDPLFEVFELQTKVRKAQENYNAALKANGPDSAKARKALLDMGKASFELTSALTNAASEGFDGKLTPAMRSALRNAGNTAKQIDALEKELIAAWRAANKWAGTYVQNYVIYESRRTKVDKQLSGGGGNEHGGIVGAATGGGHSGMRMVGEHGPELIDLPPGTQVHSNPDTQRLMGSGFGSPGVGLAGQSGGGKLEVVLRFDPSAAPDAIRGIMEGIRGEVRDGGGSVQTVLGVG